MSTPFILTDYHFQIWTVGTLLGEKLIGHSLSGAGNVVVIWSHDFDESPHL